MDALEFINIVEPEHSRTSCSDTDLQNGFYSQDGKSYHCRCKRCMYLEVLNGIEIPEDYINRNL